MSNFVHDEVALYQRHVEVSSFSREFQAIKAELSREFGSSGFDVLSSRMNAVTFCKKKTCYSISLQRNKLRCEVSVWNPQTLTAKSEVLYGELSEVKNDILSKLKLHKQLTLSRNIKNDL